ncbi:MAG: nucleoside 2-deoxyribosyltransferase [Anaerolineales bacterium]
MNIYFACSITGGRHFEAVYQAFVHALLNDGHEVPTAYLAETNVMALEKIVSAQEVYERDTAWLRACDALVAEVSVPSHGVGYEIGFALQGGKPVLCLAQQGLPVSKMISGNSDPHLWMRTYTTIEEGIEIIRKFLANALTL